VAVEVGVVSQVGSERAYAAMLAALQRPETYPDRPAAVRCVQTHYSWVFLTDRYAYKLKKPIRIRGADLRTLSARQAACQTELTLNRRLAPTTYLDVVPVRSVGGFASLIGTGRTIDWLVRMRRLPAERMADQIALRGDLRPADLDRVVARLVAFYTSLPSEPGSPREILVALEARLGEICDELARPEFGMRREWTERLAIDLHKAWRAARPDAAARASAGRVRECHGDLRAEHIYLGETIEVIDALDSEPALRVLDPAEEIAMLAVDLEHLGIGWGTGVLRDAYERHSTDRMPDGLWCFYLGLRALNRAKVALWHLESPKDYPEPEPWRRVARDFGDMAATWLRRA